LRREDRDRIYARIVELKVPTRRAGTVLPAIDS
jgi:hypothetical protein